MTDGLLLPPGAGRTIQNMTLKAGAERSKAWSTFEAVVAPGFDVGAHRHHEAEEIFYVLEGELEFLAFQPAGPATGDWRRWTAHDGSAVHRAGPGSFMQVPPGCPHAFYNPTEYSARMLFIVSPSGHEDYLQELTELLASAQGAPPDQYAISMLRARHDIEQLTPLRMR